MAAKALLTRSRHFPVLHRALRACSDVARGPTGREDQRECRPASSGLNYYKNMHDSLPEIYSEGGLVSVTRFIKVRTVWDILMNITLSGSFSGSAGYGPEE